MTIELNRDYRYLLYGIRLYAYDPIKDRYFFVSKNMDNKPVYSILPKEIVPKRVRDHINEKIK